MPLTDGPALLAAVLASPDDDAPRLVYADWCDENRQPERAEFIRLPCEADTFRRRGITLGHPAFNQLADLNRREGALLAAHPAWYAGLFGGRCAFAVPTAWRPRRTRAALPARVRRRGPVRHPPVVGGGPGLVRRHPITRVVHVDRRPSHDGERWGSFRADDTGVTVGHDFLPRVTSSPCRGQPNTARPSGSNTIPKRPRPTPRCRPC